MGLKNKVYINSGSIIFYELSKAKSKAKPIRSFPTTSATRLGM